MWSGVHSSGVWVKNWAGVQSGAHSDHWCNFPSLPKCSVESNQIFTYFVSVQSEMVIRQSLLNVFIRLRTFDVKIVIFLGLLRQ